MRQLAQWMGSPITFSGGGFGPFAIKGRLATAGTKISISDADLSLDTINAKGSIAIDHAGARPVVTGKFAVDRLDLHCIPLAGDDVDPSARGAGRLLLRAPVVSWRKATEPLWRSTPRRSRLADLDVEPQCRRHRLPRIPDRARAPSQVPGVKERPAHRRSRPGWRSIAAVAAVPVTVDGSGAAPGVGLNIALAQVQIAPAGAGADRQQPADRHRKSQHRSHRPRQQPA